MMRCLGLLSLLLIAAPAAAEPETPSDKGPLNVGFVAGTTSGLSLGIWPAKVLGVVAHLGTPPTLNSLGVHVSARILLPAVGPADGPVSVVPQIGPAFRTRLKFQPSGAFAELGGGVVVGASVLVRDLPVEFFAEVQPTFGGSVSNPGSGLGFGVEGVGGVRLFLGGKKSRTKAAAAPSPEPAEAEPVDETAESGDAEPGDADRDGGGETP